MTYKVRGPDPDGDYFIVHIIDGEETPLDETFRSEEEAIVGIEKLEAAWLEGNRAAGAEGFESQTVYNPYTDDDQDHLYDAWDAGFDRRMIHGEIRFLTPPNAKSASKP